MTKMKKAAQEIVDSDGKILVRHMLSMIINI